MAARRACRSDFFLGAELLEDLADLPVGRMNDSHDGSLSFDVATALAA